MIATSCQSVNSNQLSLSNEQQQGNEELSSEIPPLTPANTNTLGDEFNEDEKNRYITQSLEQLKRLESERQRSHGHGVDQSTLIEEVRKYPVIWSIKHKDYKDNSKQRIVWQMIFKSVDEKYSGKYIWVFLLCKYENRL